MRWLLWITGDSKCLIKLHRGVIRKLHWNWIMLGLRKGWNIPERNDHRKDFGIAAARTKEKPLFSVRAHPACTPEKWTDTIKDWSRATKLIISIFQYQFLNDTSANARQIILKLEAVETSDFLFTPQLKVENCLQIYSAKPKRCICDTLMLRH